MVKTYTLHVPADAEPGDPEALDGAEVVKDGFAWAPFLLGPLSFLWFFWNRLWLAGIGVLAAILALGGALVVLRVGTGATFLAGLLLALLIGLEANSLKRWTWRRRKPAADVVTASDFAEAETKAFSRWIANAREQRAPIAGASMPVVPYRGGEPVIGLFPDAERLR